MIRGAPLLVLSALLPVSLPSLAAPSDGPAATPSAPSNTAAPAPAASTAPKAEDAPPTSGERAVAVTSSVVPGALVHGAGHYVLGEPDTATRLLIAETIGLGMFLSGGLPLVLSGASRYLAGPATVITVTGAGIFLSSFMADLYGVASPDADAAGRRSRSVAGAESELGYQRVAGPTVTETDLVFQRVTLRAGDFRVTPSAWFAATGTGVRYRIEGAYRFWGSMPGASGRGTSDYLDVLVGGIHHRSPKELFSRSSLELQVDSRFDLARLGSTLNGAFFELSAGYAAGRIDYDIPGVAVPADYDPVLLTRFAFGAIFRGHARTGSEALLYYDHRHDAIVGGLVSRGLGSGALGRFGVDGRWFFSSNLGVAAFVEVGSAWHTGASLVFRQDGAAFGSPESAP